MTRTRKLLTGCGGLVALVVVIGVIAAVSTPSSNRKGAPNSPPTSTTSPASSATPTPTATATATATPTPASQTLLSQSGSGTGDTVQFRVTRSSWQLKWTYSCAAFGSEGNFIVTVNGYGGAAGTTDQGVNDLGTGGTGDEHYYDSGTFNLSIDSECDWTVAVVQP